MLLKELFAPLFEIDLADAQARTHNYTPTIMAHTFKILLYPNSRDVNKWRREIAGDFGLLTRSNLSTGNKRPPSGAQIITWINEIVTSQYINKILQQIVSKYGIPQTTPTNIDNLWQQIQQAYIAIVDKRENVATALSKIKI